MLRTVLAGCQRSYTCSCLVRTVVATKLPWKQGLSQPFSTSLSVHTAVDGKGRKAAYTRAMGAKTEQLEEAEDIVNLEGLTEAGITIPTLETHAMLINGTRYDELPIAHVKASLNNTIIIITNYSGTVKYIKTSCGVEGFQNVKKSTNVAAQATGISAGKAAFKQGVRHVRVMVKGLGAGRLASIKGFQMAGLEIVSISDNTPIPHNGGRPRKARRL